MRLWIAAFVVVAGYVCFRINSALDLFKTVELLNHERCERHSLPYPAEDFVEFQGLLIGGIGDNESLTTDTTKGPAATPDGWLISIEPTSFSYRNLTIEGWPQDIAFHPLGMSLYDRSTLLVVNLAYHRGGQRIEVLRLTKVDGAVRVVYQKSILFSQQFQGIINSVVQASDTEIFVTTWQPFADEETGRLHDLWTSFQRNFSWTFFRSTYLWKCSDQNGFAKCSRVYSGRILNGLAYTNGRIYVSDAGDKRVLEFKFKTNRGVHLNEKIKLDFAPDNLAIGLNSILYATGPVVGLEAIRRLSGESNTVTSTVAQLEKKGFEWEVTKLFTQNVVSGATIAIPFNGSLVLGSWHDPAFGVCSQIS